MGTEIAVMSSGSAEPGLNFVAAAFQQQTGHVVKITYNQPLEIFDVVVASSDAMQRNFLSTGKVEEQGFSIGRMGIGVAVRPGAPLPDVSNVQALKRAVLEADAILVTENHSSGMYIESMFKTLGIYGQVEAKLEHTFNGPATMDRLLAGKGREMTFLSLNEIRTYKDRGLVLAGPLPDEVQYYRDFLAAPAAQSTHKEVAREFARFCGGQGRQMMAANGFS